MLVLHLSRGIVPRAPWQPLHFDPTHSAARRGRFRFPVMLAVSAAPSGSLAAPLTIITEL